MSTLKVGAIRGVAASSDAITVASDGTCSANITSVNGGALSNRNLLINGDMRISERHGTTSKALTNAQFSLDRWQVVNDNAASKFTTQQVADAPAGFYYSLKMTSSSAYTPLSTEVFGVGQKIEGFNTSWLGFGASNPKSITISFFVKSSLTGTFGGSVLNEDMFRGFPFTYTISDADTWEKKTVTVPGVATGTWHATDGTGIRVHWSMGAGANRSDTAGQWSTTQFSFHPTGATSVVGTNAATLQITGCQVEEGSVATDFEHRPISQELALCQRYYYKHCEGNDKDICSGGYYRSDLSLGSVHFPVTMRTSPSLDHTTGTDYYGIYANNTFDKFNNFQLVSGGPNSAALDSLTGTGGTLGHAGRIATAANTAAYIAFSAEL